MERATRLFPALMTLLPQAALYGGKLMFHRTGTKAPVYQRTVCKGFPQVYRRHVSLATK